MSEEKNGRGGDGAQADVLVQAARESNFSASRGVEYLLYIANRLPKPTIHEVLKLRYFADKIHLSMFGVTASGDHYVAMEFGPVGSSTYDLLKAARGNRNSFIPENFHVLVSDALKVTEENVFPLRAADTNKLSRADIQALDSAIDQYGHLQFSERTEFSHDDAWKSGWAKALSTGSKRGEMRLREIAETLENSGEVLEYLDA